MGILGLNALTDRFQAEMEILDLRMLVLLKSFGSNKLCADQGVQHHKRSETRGPSLPFLFIIAMEGLNTTMKSIVNKGIFKGIQVPDNGPLISHLFYADDALFIGE